MADVFLSHADEDEECVRAIAGVLDARGCSVFVDKDANLPRADFIQAGDYWRATLDEELDRASFVVVLWTKHSVDKPWVRYEAQRGFANRNLISLTHGSDAPEEYRSVQKVDLGDWEPGSDSERLHNLISVVVDRVRRKRSVLDRVSLAFLARYRGDHEAAYDLLKRADEDFRTKVLDEHQRRGYTESLRYQRIVLQLLMLVGMEIARTTCGPVLRKTLSGVSFLPVVDAVLELPIEEVQRELNCCPLRPDVDASAPIRVGVVIRSGEGVQVENLAQKLVDDWNEGALALHCYLMVVNSDDSELCGAFEEAATRFGLRARGMSLPMAVLDKTQLESRMRDALHELCLQPGGH